MWGIMLLKSNIAIHPDYRKDADRLFIDFIIEKYKGIFRIAVGTGESQTTILFYEKCGFIRSHIIKIFIDNYEHPI